LLEIYSHFTPPCVCLTVRTSVCKIVKQTSSSDRQEGSKHSTGPGYRMGRRHKERLLFHLITHYLSLSHLLTRTPSTARGVDTTSSVRTGTYIHTYIYTYIHTYIHTYTYTCMHTDREIDKQTSKHICMQCWLIRTHHMTLVGVPPSLKLVLEHPGKRAVVRALGGDLLLIYPFFFRPSARRFGGPYGSTAITKSVWHSDRTLRRPPGTID